MILGENIETWWGIYYSRRPVLKGAGIAPRFRGEKVRLSGYFYCKQVKINGAVDLEVETNPNV
jgi:hypothetical protein